MATPSRPRFRFAPTPSRELHVGNALAALLGWGAARAASGTFILRVEDIDQARCRPEYEVAALDDLRWLGLDWDEGPDVGGPFAPYRQSERLARYDAALRALHAAGAAYPCACSRADIRAAQSAPHLYGAAGGGELPYPGTCRPSPADAPQTLAPDRGGYRADVARLGDDAVVSWVDGWLGPLMEDPRATCGDFLLGRPGHPSYQLAVVLDDRDMGVTDVVRGRDLAGSTARQILLHRALQAAAITPAAPPPRFWHHPLIVGQDGRKLSKRDAATSLGTWRAADADAATLCATLGRTIGLFPASVRAATPDDFADALAGRSVSMRDGALAQSDLPRAPAAPRDA